ncbi:unnamed protein product [Brachionus calyciflorus]|uniref:Proactivator polypeptide n=1 Tax=Brachionus calyciflorus TaxID=104777 RepID=A0A814B897_9BILA|nr:unnamed protein product [Brachionus calyciflorus]
MLKILFLAIFVLIGYSQADECVRGPSYWCQSVLNSKKCNSFNHCLQTVWTTHSKYMAKKNVKLSNTPNSCSNCVQCLEADNSDCHFVHLFKAEIDALKQNKIPNESICKLIRQCDENSFEIDEKPTDLNNVEYKFDTRFKCGLHPRNWCDTLETAKRCDVFETCLSKWSTLKSKLKETKSDQNSDKTCGFCLFIFQKLHQALQQNSTEVNVKDYLEGACTLLPSQQITELCLQQVDTYLPEIYNMLRNNMDPGIICRVLKQCSDANLELISEKTPQKEKKSLLDSFTFTVLNEKDVIIKTPLSQKDQNVQTEYLFGPKSDNLIDEMKRSSGVGCELCTIVMHAAKYLIQNKNDNTKVLNFIEKQLCYRMGSLKETCVQYVEQEGAEIINLLINSVDPSIVCHFMGLCLKVQITKPTEKFYDLEVRNPLNCTLCKVVFQQVKKMLTDQKSQAKILSYVDVNLCQKVGKSKELCKTLIDSYGPLFLEIIARDVHPDQLCVMIGMCASETIEEKATQVVSTSGQSCVMCEFFITVLEKYINQNSTIPEVERWMRYVCDHAMPVSIRAECSSFVTTYGDVILNLITSQVPPNKVCSSVGLCNKTKIEQAQFSEELNLFKHKSNLFLKKEKSSMEKIQESRNLSIQCTVCQYSIQYISNEYQIDRTEKAIEFTIQNVCKLTPKSYRSYCDSMVDKHGVRLINFMEKFSDPLGVCSTIKMCKVNEEEKKVLDASSVGMMDVVPAKKIKHEETSDIALVDDKSLSNNRTLKCSLCLYVSETVKEKLKLNKTEEEITKEILLVCNLFPSSLKDQCTAFVTEYGPYVIQLVAADLDPEVTCAALKLCENPPQNAFLNRRDFLNRFEN